MIKKAIRMIIHPLLVYIVIVFLQCIPYVTNNSKLVLNEMPNVADNFQIID